MLKIKANKVQRTRKGTEAIIEKFVSSGGCGVNPKIEKGSSARAIIRPMLPSRISGTRKHAVSIYFETRARVRVRGMCARTYGRVFFTATDRRPGDLPRGLRSPLTLDASPDAIEKRLLTCAESFGFGGTLSTHNNVI